MDLRLRIVETYDEGKWTQEDGEAVSCFPWAGQEAVDAVKENRTNRGQTSFFRTEGAPAA